MVHCKGSLPWEWWQLRIGYTLHGNTRQESSLALAQAEVKKWKDFKMQSEQHVYLLQNHQLGGPEKLTGAGDPRHASQENRGQADFWYLDDGDILCHPALLLLHLVAFDTA